MNRYPSGPGRLGDAGRHVHARRPFVPSCASVVHCRPPELHELTRQLHELTTRPHHCRRQVQGAAEAAQRGGGPGRIRMPFRGSNHELILVTNVAWRRRRLQIPMSVAVLSSLSVSSRPRSRRWGCTRRGYTRAPSACSRSSASTSTSTGKTPGQSQNHNAVHPQDLVRAEYYDVE